MTALKHCCEVMLDECVSSELVNMIFFLPVLQTQKDFADTIPGHGGIMDRFDCQYLMATFVHVYITSFIRYWIFENQNTYWKTQNTLG